MRVRKPWDIPPGSQGCSGAGRQYARKRPRRGSGAKLLLAFVTLSMGVLWYFTTLRYYLADYLFVTREGMGIREAIKISSAAMKGSKRTLFSLQLSLLPWRLTTVLLVPLVFVAPYYSASMAIFAKVRLESYFSKIS